MNHPFPDLEAERARLATTRAARDRMVAALSTVDPTATADEISQEFVEMVVADAIAALTSPGAGDFFGRIDTIGHDTEPAERWYIGRCHIEDADHGPLVVDWRAPVSAPFYRATAVDALGVRQRRRFTLDDGDLVAYLDEDLDDPDAAAVAAGIPDPVLAEIGAERSGEMREIVATIQGEQDVVIRSPIDGILVVQGGPGTGKTAVALHRAAYLLFEHRERLARDGVLVVGPNRAFLDYIGNVLPSLGERSVRQTTIQELCIPKVEVTAIDDPTTAAWKGDAERLAEIERAALAAIRPPTDDIVVPIGTRNHVISAELFSDWVRVATSGTVPINNRRERLRSLARAELLRRTGDDSAWADATALKKAITATWPTQRPVTLVDRMLPGPRGKRRAWTPADQLLVDEANSLLNGTPFHFGHVVIDEAQDHSAVGLRVIARRSPDRSMTLVGDVAQSTTPAGQQRWDDVVDHLGGDAHTDGLAELTIGYRVPSPILSQANRLLPLTGVSATPSSSVRHVGAAPRWRVVPTDALSDAAASTAAEVRTRHRLTGIVAPEHRRAGLIAALADRDLVGVDFVHELADGQVPIFDPEAVKGLEFDGVVIVQPHDILGGDEPTARGARLLYVAMTRAVQELAFVTDAPPPAVIAPD